MNLEQIIKLAFLIFAITALNACAVVPRTLDHNYQHSGYPNSSHQNSSNPGTNHRDSRTYFVRNVVTSSLFDATFKRMEHQPLYLHADNQMDKTLISRGDWLKLKVQAMPELDGVYQVNAAGELELPFSESVQIEGLSQNQAEHKVRVTFLNLGWFPNLTTVIDLSVVRLASIDVSVFGAVFNAGRVTINGAPAVKQQDAILQQAGAFSTDRGLAAALMAAGGVRPDANLHSLLIKRAGKLYSVDLSRLISGESYNALPTLIHGDEIFVASAGVESTELIRPTQITPPGMRVLMSNLTAPALNNALSAVGADATRLPYGSSLLDAALSANCVGGTHQANASRSIILITRHYGSNQQLVIRRSINQLLATSSDYSVNPYLMPNDGVACYDSKFTNLRDVARGLGELFGPILIGGLL